MQIAVDTGNKQIKTKHFTFVSGITSQDTAPMMGSPEHFMRFDGKYYILTNKRIPYQRDKSETPAFFTLTIMGIVKELDYMCRHEQLTYEKNKVYPITLLAGLPPAHLQDINVCKNFKRYFRTPEPVDIVYMGKKWNIKITKVKIFPQCYAAMMTNMGDINNRNRVLGIDIGGFTADYIMLRKGELDIEYTDSLENGVITLYQQIKKICQARYGTRVEELDVDDILKGDYSNFDEEICQAVISITKEFVHKLLYSFKEMDIDLKTAYVVFMGGGSVLLKQFISESDLLRNFTFIDDINANVTGYELLNYVQKKGSQH